MTSSCPKEPSSQNVSFLAFMREALGEAKIYANGNGAWQMEIFIAQMMLCSQKKSPVTIWKL
jgi:hypothetical protein